MLNAKRNHSHTCKDKSNNKSSNNLSSIVPSVKRQVTNTVDCAVGIIDQSNDPRERVESRMESTFGVCVCVCGSWIRLQQQMIIQDKRNIMNQRISPLIIDHGWEISALLFLEDIQ